MEERLTFGNVTAPSILRKSAFTGVSISKTSDSISECAGITIAVDFNMRVMKVPHNRIKTMEEIKLFFNFIISNLIISVNHAIYRRFYNHVFYNQIDDFQKMRVVLFDENFPYNYLSYQKSQNYFIEFDKSRFSHKNI